MDAAAWSTISIIGYSLAGLLFLIAIVMFFKLNIPAIIGDLTGRTAVKQIQAIREQNAMSGQKRYKPDAFNLERGSLTEPVTEVLPDSQATEVLPDGTVVLGSEVLPDANPTTVLNPTVELVGEEEEEPEKVEFKIVKDIKITHTGKRI